MAGAVRPAIRTRALHRIAALLLIVTVLLGGGGSPAPIAETMVEWASLGALAVATTLGLRPLAAVRADPVWAVLIGAVVLLPVVQLIPLPPSMWQALPGREGARAAIRAVGGAGGYAPWSLDPDATLAGALALLPAAVLLLLAAALPARERVELIAVLAVLGLSTAVLGLVQFVRGPDAVLSLYRDVHRGWGIGFFANRNAQADLLAVALSAGLLLADRHRARLSDVARGGLAVAGLLGLAGGVATGSRMGLAVLAVPVVLAIVLAGRQRWSLAGALAGGAALLLAGGTALDRVAARVHDGGARVEIWGDSLFVARSLAPVGGGVGSFGPLYAAAERLDHVQPSIANRAHNDYLELAIEGGAPALALLLAMLALVGRRAVRGWLDPDPDRRLLARFAGLTALILTIHSTVDYPLRTLTLLGVAGMALAGLASPRRAPQKPDRAGSLTDVH